MKLRQLTGCRERRRGGRGRAARRRFFLVGPAALACTLAALCWLGLAWPAYAAPDKPHPLTLHHAHAPHNLVPHMEILHDRSGRLTIHHMTKPEIAKLFKPLSGESLRILALERAVFWLRFRVRGTAAGAKEPKHQWLLELGVPYLEDVKLFIPTPDFSGASQQGWSAQSIQAVPDNERDGPAYRHAVFSLPHSVDGATSHYYLRLITRLPVNATVMLYPRDHLATRSLYGFLGFGVFYGIMLAMIILNLSMFFSLRDRVYLYYVFYTSAMLLYNFVMFGQIKSLLDPPVSVTMTLHMALVGVIYFTAGLLNRTYLSTKTYAPGWDKAIKVFMIISLVQLAAALTGMVTAAGTLGFVLGAATPIIGVATWFSVVHKGFKPSIFFLAAWVMFLIGAIIWELILLGWAPSYVWSDYGFAMGTSLEAMLLSFAMGQRVRTLREEKEALASSERRYQKLSITDGLTGLYNKRYFSSRLTSEVDHAGRLDQPMALAMLDVDRFKDFNDTYGHPAGDRVLSELARVILGSTRPDDCCCRYGGEEFSVILPGADHKEALVVADRIRIGFMEAAFQEKYRRSGMVTVSVGLATLQQGESPESLLSRADQALYRAKGQGRNRTESDG